MKSIILHPHEARFSSVFKALVTRRWFAWYAAAWPQEMRESEGLKNGIYAAHTEIVRLYRLSQGANPIMQLYGCTWDLYGGVWDRSEDAVRCVAQGPRYWRRQVARCKGRRYPARVDQPKHAIDRAWTAARQKAMWSEYLPLPSRGQMRW